MNCFLCYLWKFITLLSSKLSIGIYNRDVLYTKFWGLLPVVRILTSFTMIKHIQPLQNFNSLRVKNFHWFKWWVNEHLFVNQTYCWIVHKNQWCFQYKNCAFSPSRFVLAIFLRDTVWKDVILLLKKVAISSFKRFYLCSYWTWVFCPILQLSDLLVSQRIGHCRSLWAASLLKGRRKLSRLMLQSPLLALESFWC